jgi:hypothetical protein
LEEDVTAPYNKKCCFAGTNMQEQNILLQWVARNVERRRKGVERDVRQICKSSLRILIVDFAMKNCALDETNLPSATCMRDGGVACLRPGICSI